MSTIQIERKWQPEPTKNLVGDFPVQEGKKIYEQSTARCVICAKPKVPCVFDHDNTPLVLMCINCGHKSWANAASLC